ncbi:MAG: nicotinate-nucleotide diphosphorylase (carboxylating) [Henriciella sp.]|uniref:carboxylating nicotinate-nucleotide diphosphorylase n=1 Tax=Henriciella sp. TaxID=1968823 RepID=UPI000C110D09|nr:carboxylating nicotinate-nucleotide diphosphorylase [Henriciella sp.]MAN72698.1 nicotinate-nucleotide diphosphorylase (carboxylating) [Henriciella sp.]MBF35065.1 nicotinate-nucleotide diphosphorylase (carboxylating) [Hyphomonadaceae bacterium]MBK76530.1 nicotinate-nucleotide diphosphorylase (carboxylating) [Henriciella sp.]PHR78596.1 MAG: nicotinate-nucleotide diphosphorylase (carboxylating) [Henriciella sp.]|tara:strand:+ start:918 stop:1769 length:852 start_codon:yes stop_codon:yes gene_type:complete
MPPPPPLPDLILDPIVRLALTEDLGRAGDLTTDATIAPGTQMRAEIRARKAGILAGMDAAAYALKLVDPAVELDVHINDGGKLAPGAAIAALSGPARSILTAERTMLNFLGRLSGIATLTGEFVEKVSGTDATIVCTRKTTPGHRAVEKRAVRCGGGTSHRYGLDDAILIKDNHIAACGSISEALKRAHAYAGHLRMIEIEVDTLEQLEEALPHKPHAVLLDNMDTGTLKKAVAMIDGTCKAEASGGVNLETVAGIAATGVDYISVGALTHSASNLDVGLDVA